MWTGKEAVPLNPMLKPGELDFLIKDAAIDTVVVAEATAALLAGLNVQTVRLTDLLAFDKPASAEPVRVDPDTPAVMLYTSGTPGKPKGVPLTHTNLLSNSEALIERFAVGSGEVFLGVLPMFHAFGLTGSLILPLMLGAEVTYQPRFHPDRSTAAIAERRVSVFIAVPPMFGLLARTRGHDEGLRGVRFPVSGGEALPSGYRDAYRQRFGRDVLEAYGLTETSPAVAINRPEDNRPGTVGRPLRDIEVRLSGEDREIQVARAERHEGLSQSAGGERRRLQRRRLVPHRRHGTDRCGWLSEHHRTDQGADYPRRREDHAAEVEDVLGQYPGVQEAAVIGEPDGDRGEAVIAFVVPGDAPPTPEALREHCRTHLAEFKVPRRITVARDLPRGPTGKLLKRALRDWKPV